MIRKKRIYYISPNGGAISYYRCTMPAFYLNRAGLAETAVDFGRFQKEFVDWADVIVVQRVLGNGIKHLINYCHMKDKKVVFEIDDNVWKFPDSPEYKSEQAKDVPGKTTDIMRGCDAVTVSTQAIADSVMEESKTPVHIVPNALDLMQWKPMPNIRHEHFLVGWAGGHYHVQDLEMIVQGLKEIINKNKGTTLVFLGCCPMELLTDHPDKVFMHEFVSMELFPKTMAVMRFDIGLAPLYETEFAKSRSNIRLLQYGALQIPSVVSHYGEYGRMMDDGFPAVGVSSGNWSESIQELIDNPEKRLRIGKEAQKYVVEKYDIKDNIHKWMDVYNNL